MSLKSRKAQLRLNRQELGKISQTRIKQQREVSNEIKEFEKQKLHKPERVIKKILAAKEYDRFRLDQKKYQQSISETLKMSN